MKVYAKDDFRGIRVRKGLTLQQIAEKTGYTTSAFGKIERRLNGISPRRVETVLTVLEMSFDDCFELVRKN